MDFSHYVPAIEVSELLMVLQVERKQEPETRRRGRGCLIEILQGFSINGWREKKQRDIISFENCCKIDLNYLSFEWNEVG